MKHIYRFIDWTTEQHAALGIPIFIATILVTGFVIVFSIAIVITTIVAFVQTVLGFLI